MNFQIDAPWWGGRFTVPCKVSQYLKLSSEVQLKVLLYIFSEGASEVNTSIVAEALSVSEDAVEESIIYWHSLGIFTIKGKQVADLTKAAEPVSLDVLTLHNTKEDKTIVAIPAREISQTDTLVEQVEKTLKRKLKAYEKSSLLDLHQGYRFPVTSLVMLCEYCYSIGKDRFLHIESLAKEWHRNGIVEVKDIEPEIKRLLDYNAYETKVKNSLGFSSRTSRSQETFFRKWHELSLPIELIEHAAEISIDKTKKHDVSLEYMNSILLSWNRNGIQTVEQVKSRNMRNTRDKNKSREGNKREKAGSKYADRHRERLLKLLGED